ncbi:MAG: peptide-methionine (S)-S-oxide reductase MsrA [Pseudomonadota bacterium]
MIRPIALASIISVLTATGAAHAETKSLIVAGGCFWCVEKDFEHVDGVIEATSGYAGGELANPTYRNHGRHREVVRIDYDSNVTDYKTLVDVFLRTIDPTDPGGQFCDRGRSYSTAIHAFTPEEMSLAEQAVAEGETVLGQTIVTPVEGAVRFWEAEEYHQNYYKSQVPRLTRFGAITRADAYVRYRQACGRDQRVRQLWGDAAYIGVSHAQKGS